MNPSLYDVFGSFGKGISTAVGQQPKDDRQPALAGLGAGLSWFGEQEPTRAQPGDWIPVLTTGLLVVGVAVVAGAAIVLLRR